MAERSSSASTRVAATRTSGSTPPGKRSPLIASPVNEAAASFSPDGRFIAFDADDGGVSHVYLQPFPGPGPRTTVSAEEGGWPRWRADGRELAYRSGERLMVVAVQTDPVLRIGRPQMVLESRDGRRGYAGVAPDGRRSAVIFQNNGRATRAADHPQLVRGARTARAASSALAVFPSSSFLLRPSCPHRSFSLSIASRAGPCRTAPRGTAACCRS